MSANNRTIDYLTVFKGCFDSIITGFFFNSTYLLLVFPLSTSVLLLGLKRWKRQRSSGTTMNHSDFFTYNMAVVELIGVLSAVIDICNVFLQSPVLTAVGFYLSSFPWNAQMMFPILICVDRYLAVVRPITYMRVRQTTGIRIRNVSTAVIWLQCFMGVSGTALYVTYPLSGFVPASLMAVCLIIVTFCSLSILCVLIGQRPGSVGHGRQQLDPSKRRALRVILVIMAVLFFRFGGNLVCYSLAASPTTSLSVWCFATVSGFWLTLPSSLVLPLLFLLRNVKIPGFKSSK